MSLLARRIFRITEGRARREAPLNANIEDLRSKSETGAKQLQIFYAAEAHVWIAENETVGLILESESYDLLIKKIKDALPELIDLNHVRIQ